MQNGSLQNCPVEVRVLLAPPILAASAWMVTRQESQANEPQTGLRGCAVCGGRLDYLELRGSVHERASVGD